MERILIVEDDDDVRESLGEVLRDEGYEVATAANGLDALEALRAGVGPDGQGAPCTIILDLMMPTMNGWDFRAHQLQEPALAKIPVIVVSGVAHLASTASLRPAAVIGKPVDLDRLLAEIHRHC